MKKIAKYILNQVAANQLSPEEAKAMLLELENQESNQETGGAHADPSATKLPGTNFKKASAISKFLPDYSPNQLNPFYELKDFQSFEIDQEESKVLRIQPHNEITTYLCHALPLSVILTNPKLIPWYYEHFIDLYAIVDEFGYLKLDFLEFRAPYKEVIHEVYLGYQLLKNETNIIHFICDKINLGYYVIIHADEYYLPVKKWYHKEHFVHHSLIYGYDNPGQTFRAIGFNAGEIFTEITFGYDTFAEAFEQGKKYYQESAPWAENNAVELLKLKDYENEYPFDIRRFLGKLNSYLSATGDTSVIFSFNWKPSQVAYGMDVYREIVHSLEKLTQGQITIDYRAIHLLYEHKKGFYQRLQYILEKFLKTGNQENMLKEYSRIVDQVGAIRRKFLELNYSGSGLKINELTGSILETIASIKEIQASEQKIFQEIRDWIQDEILPETFFTKGYEE